MEFATLLFLLAHLEVELLVVVVDRVLGHRLSGANSTCTQTRCLAGRRLMAGLCGAALPSASSGCTSTCRPAGPGTPPTPQAPPPGAPHPLSIATRRPPQYRSRCSPMLRRPQAARRTVCRHYARGRRVLENCPRRTAPVLRRNCSTHHLTLDLRHRALPRPAADAAATSASAASRIAAALGDAGSASLKALPPLPSAVAVAVGIGTGPASTASKAARRSSSEPAANVSVVRHASVRLGDACASAHSPRPSAAAAAAAAVAVAAAAAVTETPSAASRCRCRSFASARRRSASAALRGVGWGRAQRDGVGCGA